MYPTIIFALALGCSILFPLQLGLAFMKAKIGESADKNVDKAYYYLYGVLIFWSWLFYLLH